MKCDKSMHLALYFDTRPMYFTLPALFVKHMKIWVCLISLIKVNAYLSTNDPLTFKTRGWLRGLIEGMGGDDGERYLWTLANSNLSCFCVYKFNKQMYETNQCLALWCGWYYINTLLISTQDASVFSFTKFCLFLGNCFCIQRWHEFDKIRTLQK